MRQEQKTKSFCSLCSSLHFPRPEIKFEQLEKIVRHDSHITFKGACSGF
jgi:hypothetical protein